MASVSAVALEAAVIPLQPSFCPEDLRAAKIEHSWTTTGNNPEEKCSKMCLPVCDDPSQKEVFLHVIDAFLDAAHNDRLHLAVGSDRHNKFRQVLGGSLRISWQAISGARQNKTVDTFDEDLRELVAKCLAPAARADQLNCLAAANEPFEVDCEALGARFEVMSRLGRLLPSSHVAGVDLHLWADTEAMKLS